MEKQEKLLLRGTEVAEALNISRALAYRWMAAGILPVVRMPRGRAVRVPQQALMRWIETHTAGAVEGANPPEPKQRQQTRHLTDETRERVPDGGLR
jgi:excisionase family DNA binding protein